MVVIISQQIDPSTDKVIDWLYYKGVSFARINGDEVLTPDSLTTFELSADENKQTIKNKYDISSAEISSVWHRRDATYFFPQNFLSDLRIENFYADMLDNLSGEYSTGKKAFYACLEFNKKRLGNFRKSTLNKIDTLIIAKKNGIDIPATIITNSKADLKSFIKKHGSVITKPIKQSFGFKNRKTDPVENYVNFTEEVTAEDLEKVPEKFFYSLFQENLNKEIEIRTFFLDGECYSMAIFSQLDDQTKVDFRKYNNNRNVPYRLSGALEEKIVKMMNELELNTGSLDIVKTKDGRFVFLEVNPVGQYEMTSVPCNYNLDEKIADYLTSGDGR